MMDGKRDAPHGRPIDQFQTHPDAGESHAPCVPYLGDVSTHGMGERHAAALRREAKAGGKTTR